MNFFRILFLFPLVLAWFQSTSAAPSPGGSLQRDFQRAAREFGVPESLLLSVSYHLTLWEDHGGRPSTSGGYGPMELTQVPGSRDPALHTLDQAARLLHLNPRVLKHDPAQNIRGGAALLALDARAAGGRPRTLEGWRRAVARFAGSAYFADSVYRTMALGVTRRLADGQIVSLAARTVAPRAALARGRQPAAPTTRAAECPASLHCRFVPAAYKVVDPSNPEDYGNYDVANRKKLGMQYRYIIIHDTEGPYSSAINTFQDPLRFASAHYVIRSSDGQITQMVLDRDIAWHAGNYYVNMHSIGIEHEGVAIQGATWYGEQLYESSAALVTYLAARFHIPLDRQHVVGHDEVPGTTPQTQRAQHWDPGPFWDWGHYMDLLNASITPSDLAASKLVAIDPAFATNHPIVSPCSGCAALPGQPSNFVYLRTAPSPGAPLAGDNALGSPGTWQAGDWGDKAVTGARYVVAGRHGEWVAVDYGGKELWIDNPPSSPVLIPAQGSYVTPKTGRTNIPVYGSAWPEPSAYPPVVKASERPKLTPLQYTIPAGQRYALVDKVRADYYWSPTMTQHLFIQGKTSFYQIVFNHRFAFVRASDVAVKTPAAPPTPTPSPTASPTSTPTSTLTTTPTPTAYVSAKLSD